MAVLFIVLLLTACAFPVNDSTAPAKIEVYFIEWNITSRFAYSVQDLKGFDDAAVKGIDLSNAYDLVADHISQSKVAPICKPKNMDGRILLEAQFSDGRSEVLFGDRFCLCNLTTPKCVANLPHIKSRLSEMISRQK